MTSRKQTQADIMHLFNSAYPSPVPIGPLVELLRGARNLSTATAVVLSRMKTLCKQGVVKDASDRGELGWVLVNPPDYVANVERITACGGTYPGEEYDEDETAFLRELERWKKLKRTKFPSPVQILRLAKAMGYRKVGGE